MTNKKLLIIAGVAIVMLQLRRTVRAPANVQQQQQQQNLNGLAGLASSVARLFSGAPAPQSVTVRPGSSTYGGVRNPSTQVINSAAQASNNDQDQNLNGSPLYVPDAEAVNPPFNSAYDYTNESWY